jgi:hypothetical protein
MLSAKFISQREGFRYSILPLSLTGWNLIIPYWKMLKLFNKIFNLLTFLVS